MTEAQRYTAAILSRQPLHIPRPSKLDTASDVPQNTQTASSFRRTIPPFSTVIASSSPSWMLNSLRVSAGTTIRPRSSIFLTMSVSTTNPPFSVVGLAPTPTWYSARGEIQHRVPAACSKAVPLPS